jgi:hypothetical protein
MHDSTGSASRRTPARAAATRPPVSDSLRALLQPHHLFTRTEVMARDSPVPKAAGIYAWYFDQAPAGVETNRCHRLDGSSLLYTGISPASPRSKATLNTRIRAHYGNANASGSTLRLTLGVLLADQLGIELRREGQRHTFGTDGETRLTLWMADHARVAWHPVSEPWTVEPTVIHSLDLPLNLRGNESHPFHATLSRQRRSARASALDRYRGSRPLD